MATLQEYEVYTSTLRIYFHYQNKVKVYKIAVEEAEEVASTIRSISYQSDTSVVGNGCSVSHSGDAMFSQYINKKVFYEQEMKRCKKYVKSIESFYPKLKSKIETMRKTDKKSYELLVDSFGKNISMEILGSKFEPPISKQAVRMKIKKQVLAIFEEE